MDGERFEVVEEFIYLGTLVTCDNDVSREVKRRVAAANTAFYGLRSQLRSRSMQTRTKFAIYKTLILPVLLYGHESWTLREADRRVLGVFERKVLRSILGGKLENGIWLRRMNHELYQVYKSADTVGWICSTDAGRKTSENNIQSRTWKRTSSPWKAANPLVVCCRGGFEVLKRAG